MNQCCTLLRTSVPFSPIFMEVENGCIWKVTNYFSLNHAKAIIFSIHTCDFFFSWFCLKGSCLIFGWWASHFVDEPSILWTPNLPWESLIFPHGSLTNPLRFPVTPSPWTRQDAYKVDPLPLINGVTWSPWKWMVGILVSYWDGLFSGAMLVSGSVDIRRTWICFVPGDSIRDLFIP